MLEITLNYRLLIWPRWGHTFVETKRILYKYLTPNGVKQNNANKFLWSTYKLTFPLSNGSHRTN